MPIEFYRQVKLNEKTVDKINKIATEEGRSFASQSGLILEMGLKQYEKENKK